MLQHLVNPLAQVRFGTGIFDVELAHPWLDVTDRDLSLQLCRCEEGRFVERDKMGECV